MRGDGQPKPLFPVAPLWHVIAANTAPELILANGTVHPPNGAELVDIAVREGRIMALGSWPKMKRWPAPRRPIHILHITTPAELELIARQRDIATCEVTPQHLTLAAEDAYPRLERKGPGTCVPGPWPCCYRSDYQL